MEKMPFTYARDILPHMPKNTQITPEKGQLILEKLGIVGFDKQRPDWKFEDAFEWANDSLNEPGRQVDLAILKRFVALHIDASEEQNLDSIKDKLLVNSAHLRWIVLADVPSEDVSDARIAQRWQQFIETLIPYAPIIELLNNV